MKDLKVSGVVIIDNIWSLHFWLGLQEHKWDLLRAFNILNNTYIVNYIHMNSSKILLLSLLLIFFSTGLNASENNYEALDSGIVALKKEVLSLNRELRILEEKLHFSSNTRFSIFLSMKTGLKSNLESVQLQIDEKNIAHHFYTKSELASLNRGGVQRLYTANLSSGKHEIVAVFSGVSLNGEDYRRDQKIVIDKTSKPQFVEFTIDRGISKKHPAFSVMAWK